MTLKILAISSSPAVNSSSARLTDHVLELCSRRDDLEYNNLRLAHLDAQALVSGNSKEPGISQAAGKVAEADGIILVTPIYKASFTGLLKCFLDLLPQFAFAGKAVLPLATGGSLAHALALDYALRPVLQSMGARHVVQGLLVLQSQMTSDELGRVKLEPRAENMLSHAIAHFMSTTTSDPHARLLGHPDPERPMAHA